MMPSLLFFSCLCTLSANTISFLLKIVCKDKADLARKRSQSWCCMRPIKKGLELKGKVISFCCLVCGLLRFFSFVSVHIRNLVVVYVILENRIVGHNFSHSVCSSVLAV